MKNILADILRCLIFVIDWRSDFCSSTCCAHAPCVIQFNQKISLQTHHIIISSGFSHSTLPSTGTRSGKNHWNPPAQADGQDQRESAPACGKKEEKVSFSNFPFSTRWKIFFSEAQISLTDGMFTMDSMIEQRDSTYSTVNIVQHNSVRLKPTYCMELSWRFYD